MQPHWEGEYEVRTAINCANFVNQKRRGMKWILGFQPGDWTEKLKREQNDYKAGISKAKAEQGGQDEEEEEGEEEGQEGEEDVRGRRPWRRRRRRRSGCVHADAVTSARLSGAVSAATASAITNRP